MTLGWGRFTSRLYTRYSTRGVQLWVVVVVCTQNRQYQKVQILKQMALAVAGATFFRISKTITMKPKHIDLEAILEPFWPHLGVLGRPLGAFLGILGPT